MRKRNIKVTIAYDGSNYHGWAIQNDVPTIEGTIIDSLFRLLEKKVKICGTSRTDAGVHAFGQTANISFDSNIPTENIKRAFNQFLPDDIVFTHVEDAPKGFNPIGDPKNKLYRYKIFTGKDKPVFERNHCWHYPYLLDENDMQDAAQRMVGTKDFKSFASAKDYRKDSIRTIMECSVKRNGDWIEIDVRGNRFMYNMVRNMVGTLVEVGRGRWCPEKIDEIMAACDRKAAGILAPAAGLYLMEIVY